MRPFEIAKPSTLKEAVELLDSEDPSIRPIGGGTALMLMMKSGLFVPRLLISLQETERFLRFISIDQNGSLKIGALASLRKLEKSDLAPAVVRRTMKTLSNVRVRNVATIGGSLAHADPHMDLPPVLISLGASVDVVGPQGGRTIGLDSLYKSYYETTLAKDELISFVSIPPLKEVRAAYKKVTTRSVDDWPALGVAVAFSDEENEITEAKIVLSAATETPTRLKAAESVLMGAKINETILQKASDAAADEAQLVGDPQGSAAYKRELLRVTIRRAVRAAQYNGVE